MIAGERHDDHDYEDSDKTKILFNCCNGNKLIILIKPEEDVLYEKVVAWQSDILRAMSKRLQMF